MATLLCLFPAIGVVYLLIVVPIVGSRLSGWPATPTAVRFSAAVGASSVVLSLVGAAVLYVLWDRGITGDKFPFDLEVPPGFEGLVLVEACPSAPEDDGVARVSAQGLARIRHDDPQALFGRSTIDVREAGGGATQAGVYTYELDPATGCGVLCFAVSPTSPWSSTFPEAPITELLREARSSGRTVTEVSKERSAPVPDPTSP